MDIKEEIIETLKSKEFTRQQLIEQIMRLHHFEFDEAKGVAYNLLLDSRIQYVGTDEENVSIYRIASGEHG
jgi:hypothetical protein